MSETELHTTVMHQAVTLPFKYPARENWDRCLDQKTKAGLLASLGGPGSWASEDEQPEFGLALKYGD